MSKQVTLTIQVDEVVARLLAVLDEDRSAESTLSTLANHAAQGVYRPGAWERDWIEHVFHGPYWHKRMEPGCPFGRVNCEGIFERPRLHGSEVPL